MKPISVLILRPDLKDPGGVANYYNLVKKYFNSKDVSVEYFYIGKTDGNDNHDFISSTCKTISDLYLLCRRLSKFDLVVFNPSLDIKAVLRDGLFHLTAKHIYKRRTLVFFRGWTPKLESIIGTHASTLFKFLFDSDMTCVLSMKIKAKLIEWGFNPERVIIETTTFEGRTNHQKLEPNKIIFLSRFVQNKGCLHAIKAIEFLASEFPSIHLFMAGDGPLLGELKDYVKSHNLDDLVTFTGYVSGSMKYDILCQCGIMLYPTFYGEGMPNSLLEGMGMGLVPVTRPVGGIQDIIVDGRNGFLIGSSDPGDFAARITALFKDKRTWQSMSDKNLHESWEKFEIKNVVKRLESVFLNCVQSDKAKS